MMEGKRFAMDIITHLPSHIIDHILSLLPIRDAVRTSILARAWRHKWLTIPCLVFDRDLPKYSPEFVIYNALLFHRGRITKFSVNCPSMRTSNAVDHWLRFLSNHPIEDLTLKLAGSARYVLSSYVYNFKHLKHLELDSVEVRCPPYCKGFDKLVAVDLNGVWIELGGLKSLISRSPMLELLNLCNCHFDPYLWLDIDAPKLKRFHFSGEFRAISFENAGSLEDISIQSPKSVIWKDLEDESNMIHGFDQLMSIKKLCICADVLKFLAVGGVPHDLPNTLDRLTFLRLHSINFICIDNAACALCLIRSSPNLETLEIDVARIKDGVGMERKFVVHYLKEQKNCNVPFSHLKHVRIEGLSGLGPELEFVKLLLEWLTALTRLEIVSTFSGEYCNLTKFNMLKELASCRRASPEAVLVFC